MSPKVPVPRIRRRFRRALRGRRVPWRSRNVQDRLLLAAKAALAAGIAWAVGRYVLRQGESAAYWAPLTAVFVMSPTVARSLTEGAQFVVGFLLGVGVGMTAGILLGPNVYGIIAVVFVALLIGSWSKLGGQAVEVPFIGLFVLLFGGDTPLDFVPPRLVEVGVGAVAGVLVNVTVLPPLHLRPAQQSLRRLRDDAAALLTEMAWDLEERWSPEEHAGLTRRARRLNPVVAEARAAASQAVESARLNPRTPRWGGPPRRTQEAVFGLELITASVIGIARTLDRAAADGDSDVELDGGFRIELAQLLRDTAAMVDEYAIPFRRQPGTTSLNEVVARLRRLQRDAEPRPGGVWLAKGQVLLEMERILGELLSTPSRGSRG